MKVTEKSRLQYRIQYLVFIFLLVGSIGFAGWLSNEYDSRSDWTAGGRHSLSDDSILLLQQLTSPVSLRSYQPDNNELGQAITEILNRYKDQKHDFSFELINPDIFIERAGQDGVERYGQTIIEYQDKTERIDRLSEETITNALLRLHRGNKPQLLFVTQHGERSISDESATGYRLLANKLNTKGFKLKAINLLQHNIDPINSVLVLSSINKPLVNGEQKKILEYINSGGNLLWLQDPSIDTTQQAIADALALEFLPGVMIDNNEEVNRMLQLSHPAIIPILEYKLHPITEKMQYFTLFTTASGIREKTQSSNTDTNQTPAPWKHSQLLIASSSSWSEQDNFLLDVKFDPTKDIAGPISIGNALHRQLTLNDKKINQRVVVIGDTDFLANNNLGHGANLDLIIKSFNWLAQADQLISISPKNAPDLQLNLSITSLGIISIGFLIILPLILFGSGGYIWFKRSKR